MDLSGGDGDTAYEVLARKYRPADFRDLIGQDSMVQTLANAFAHDRIAHAYVLTGVRGVGKTTIVRAIAQLAEAAGARVLLASPTASHPVQGALQLWKHLLQIRQERRRHARAVECGRIERGHCDGLLQQRPASQDLPVRSGCHRATREELTPL